MILGGYSGIGNIWETGGTGGIGDTGVVFGGSCEGEGRRCCSVFVLLLLIFAGFIRFVTEYRISTGSWSSVSRLLGVVSKPSVVLSYLFVVLQVSQSLFLSVCVLSVVFPACRDWCSSFSWFFDVVSKPTLELSLEVLGVVFSACRD